jgi:hypothetical protein
MAVTAWKFAGTGANDAAVGNAAWATPGNITASNNTYAQTATMGAGQTSQILRATNFGFTTSDIPDGSTIDGIEVRIERARATGGGTNVRDNAIILRKSTGQVGDNKAVTTVWPTADGTATYGAADDVWGASFTDTEILNSGFGVDIRCERTQGTAAGRVDAVEIRVHYTESGGELTETPTDSVSFADEATKQVSNVASDSIGFADAEIKQVDKLQTDSIGFADNATKDFSKVDSDSVSFTDASNLYIYKLIEDTISFTDEETTAIVLSLDLDDSISFADSVVKDFDKNLQDSISFVDEVAKALSKVLGSEISFEDVYSDELLQIVSLSLDDSISFTDAHIKDVSNVIQDTLDLTDSEAKAFATILADSVSLEDSAVKQSNKHLSDGVGFDDDIQKHNQKYIEENVSFTEVFDYEIGEEDVISLSLSDLVYFNDDENTLILTEFFLTKTFNAPIKVDAILKGDIKTENNLSAGITKEIKL